MTFDEMKRRYDSGNAFTDFLTIKNAEYVGVIPEDFHGVFPVYCECGSENIINFTRTKISCCNPRCFIKQGLALSELFSRFNIKGIADATCSEVYKMLFKIDSEKKNIGEEGLFASDSYIEILLLDEDKYPIYFRQTIRGSDFISAVNIIRNKVLTFPELVAKLGLPEFDSTAYKLFYDINSFDELKQLIEESGGVSSFCEKRGVYAPLKKFWLEASMSDILVADYIFSDNRRLNGLKQFDVCITGSLHYNGIKYTKNDFIALCNYNSSANLTNILKDVINEYKEVSSKQLKELGSLVGGNILPSDAEMFTAEEISIYLDSMRLPPVQIFDVKMTTAKKSVPYIIADVPSNSAKYLEGLRRGIEIDADGSERKVLVTSNEFMEILQLNIENWKKELTTKCKKILQSTEMTIF